jgi:hypothetical protein
MRQQFGFQCQAQSGDLWLVEYGDDCTVVAAVSADVLAMPLYPPEDWRLGTLFECRDELYIMDHLDQVSSLVEHWGYNAAWAQTQQWNPPLTREDLANPAV